MSKSIRRISFLLLLVCCINKNGIAQPLPPRGENSLVYWAKKLQEKINPGNTEYRHKDNLVDWGDQGGQAQCYADCSGFINALLARSLRWNEDNFQKIFGHKRMYAYHYFEAITGGNHFAQIKNIREVQPGNLIALQYADRSEHEDNTGHVMLIASFPRMHPQSKVLEPNTDQYEVEVIDCSKSGHGKTDSRNGANGSTYSGLGKGLFRLYTDRQGNIVAYSWSIGNPKEGFNPFENPVVVGRLLTQNL